MHAVHDGQAGMWEQINAALRDLFRVAEGKATEPTAVIVDSQSVKTTKKEGARFAR